MKKRKDSSGDIAIIGVAGRFPGADNVSEYWSNIKNKINSVVHFSDEELLDAGVSQATITNPNYVKAKGYLANADLFDANFFRFSQYEAEQLDPQFRIFLEEVWRAFEDAGYLPDKMSGKVGVFAGSSNVDTYYYNNLLKNTNSVLSPDNFTALLFNSRDFLSNLVAYKLNLTGPAVTIQTACSTSLVSVAMACQSLSCFEADVAIAGGVCVTTPLKSGYQFQEGMMLSPSGKCSTFDTTADGIVLGNGCGVVVLKRLSEALSDNDNIYAVIKGYAVNHDGSSKVGFTAPGVSGQVAVLKTALEKAKIDASSVSYIEAHGTGTVLGDLIEFEALKEVYQGAGKVCLGAVKPNIGHLDAASGIAGLIKTVLALKQRQLPPNINFLTPSEHLKFSDSPFYVNTAAKPWAKKNNLRYAAVSSFGMGGTNAHVILEEAPNIINPRKSISPRTFSRKRYWSHRTDYGFLGHKTLASASAAIRPNKKTLKINEIEAQLTKIFERILFKDNIDVNTGFDSLGGDSFSALLIIHEINKLLGLKVPVSILDESITIRILSYIVASHVENQ